MNSDAEDIIFTSSGSEANTLAILGLSKYLTEKNKKHIITSMFEHPSVLNAMKEMEQRGFEITYLNVENGFVSAEDFKDAIRIDTGFASIMFVNNEIGEINDVGAIYKLCRQNEILFHSDCVQALCSEEINMEEIADFVSISGHKIHAPKGAGCLCAKRKELLTNIIFGGEQEFGLRPGTENVAAIAAMGLMASICNEFSFGDNKIVNDLSRRFKKKLLEICEKEEIMIFFNDHIRTSPKICSFGFDGIDGESLALMLSSNNIYVSAGSACTSNSVAPSHVLKAIGLSDDQARSTIRVSFSAIENEECNIEEVAEEIIECVKLLSSIKKNNA